MAKTETERELVNRIIEVIQERWYAADTDPCSFVALDIAFGDFRRIPAGFSALLDEEDLRKEQAEAEKPVMQ